MQSLIIIRILLVGRPNVHTHCSMSWVCTAQNPTWMGLKQADAIACESGVVAWRYEQIGQHAELVVGERQLVQVPRVLMRPPEFGQRLLHRVLEGRRNAQRRQCTARQHPRKDSLAVLAGA